MEGLRQIEEKDKIIVKWAQEDVETSNNLLNNNKFSILKWTEMDSNGLY